MSLAAARPTTPVGRSASITRPFGRSPSPHSDAAAASNPESEATPLGTPGWRKRVLSHRLTFQKDNASAENLVTTSTMDAGPKDLVELEQLRATIQSLHQQTREARARRRHSVPPGDELFATFSQPDVPSIKVSTVTRSGSVRRKAVPVCDVRILDPVSEYGPCPLPVTASVPTFERGFPFSKPTHVMDVDSPTLYVSKLSSKPSADAPQPVIVGDDAPAVPSKTPTPRKSRSRKRVSRVRVPTPPRRVSSQAPQLQHSSSGDTTEADSDSVMSRKSLCVANSSIPPRRSSKVEHVVTLSPTRQMSRRNSVHSLRTKASTQSLRSPSRAPPMPANSAALASAAATASEEASPHLNGDETSAASASRIPPPRPARRRLRTSSSKMGLNGKSTSSPARPRTAESLQTDDDDAASFCSATWDPEAEDAAALEEPSSPSCSDSESSFSSSSSLVSSGLGSRPTSEEPSLKSKSTSLFQDCLGAVLASPA